jgi:hypothetical protein
MPPQQKKSRRGLWIALAIIGGVILLGCAICGIASVAGIGFFAKSVAAPALTATQYYNAVQKQDYTTAFSFTNLNSLTQDAYTKAAQLLDTAKGPVTSYSIGNVAVNNNTASVIVSVTRGSNTPYIVHLQLQQVNGSWKITSFDNI